MDQRTLSASSSSRSCLLAAASSFLDFRPGFGLGGKTHYSTASVFVYLRDSGTPAVLLARTEVVAVTAPEGAAIFARLRAPSAESPVPLDAADCR